MASNNEINTPGQPQQEQEQQPNVAVAASAPSPSVRQDPPAKTMATTTETTSETAATAGSSGSKRTLQGSEQAATAETKRSKTADDSQTKGQPKKGDDAGEVLDLATHFSIRPGDRVEVEWEVLPSTSEEEDATAAAGTTKARTRWWGATLLPHDGRTDDSVAIRTLEYDSYPEGGFPDKSKEDVIFIGHNTVLNYKGPDAVVEEGDEEILQFRLPGRSSDGAEGDGGAVYVTDRDDIEKVVNDILVSAMANNESKFKNLDRASQAHIAQKVASKREKLISLLEQRFLTGGDDAKTRSSGGGIVTPADMREILAQTMND